MSRNRQNSTKSTASLTPQQSEVIAALVTGATVTDATKQANVDRTTFYLWLRSDAKFVEELNRAKKERAEALRFQLSSLSEPALATLREMLTGKEVAAGVRLKAALSVLQSMGMLEPESVGSPSHSEVEMRQMLDSL